LRYGFRMRSATSSRLSWSAPAASTRRGSQAAPKLEFVATTQRSAKPWSPLCASCMIYFEDLVIGAETEFGSYEVTREEVLEFARKYDPQPFHLSDEAAAKTHFGRLAASGWHTAALTMRLLVQGGVPIAGGMVGAGGEIRWPKPTRPGDTLRVHSEIVEIAQSRSRPDRGIVTIRIETRNQHGDTVQLFVGKLIVPRRT